jgi:GTP pyrophosphokinase
MKKALTKAEVKLINELVAHYVEHKDLMTTFGNSVRLAVRDSGAIKPYVHSMRFRMKDPDHLADKLRRKLISAKAEGNPFEIAKDNLFTRVTDLAGLRLLHLHTTQFAAIDRTLKQIIDEQPIELLEGPFARTWDDEYRKYFQSLGVETQESETMYTSVHYIVSSKMKTTMTCEIQVRTLMEEVWGEVDHSINYPHRVDSIGCREQIRALARSTSAATRLVDAIFATYTDFQDQQQPREKQAKTAKT